MEDRTLRATDTVEIGQTGLRVSRLGLGGVALSGAPPATDLHQATAEADAIALIQRSLALGLNYLDTAPMYGVGRSEQRYGQALRGVARESYVLSTKVGRVLKPEEPGGAQLAWAFDFSQPGVRSSFALSLERLGLERIDILYIHDPDDHYQQALTQALPVLLDLRSQGLVTAIGAAGMNQWEMELCSSVPKVEDRQSHGARVDADRHPDAGVRPGDLLEDEDVGEEVRAA